MEYIAKPVYVCIRKGIDIGEQIGDECLQVIKSVFCPYCGMEHDCYIAYGRDVLIDNNEDSPTYHKMYAKPVSAIVCTRDGEKKIFQNMDTCEFSKRNPMYEITNEMTKSVISKLPLSNKKENESIMNEENKPIAYEDEIKLIQKRIDNIPSSISVGKLSDRYHTFDELYHHRALLFASLCMTTFKDKVWKSLLHDDPENNPMYNGMFIVGVDTPFGQASYHYDIYPYWNKFKVKEVEKAPKFDGHTPSEAIDRLYKYAMKIAEESTTITKSFIDNGPHIINVTDYSSTGHPVNMDTYHTT